jgi:hypothetical protein
MVRRRARILIVVGTIMALFLAVAPDGAGAQVRRGWHLVDYQQSGCFSSNVTTHYYAIYIEGRWGRALDIGITGLPAGGTFTTSYAPIPPGSSDGEHSLAYVGVHLPSDTALGTYTADLWAGNERRTESVPVTLVVKTTCGY